jgi:hypothetical protein
MACEWMRRRTASVLARHVPRDARARQTGVFAGCERDDVFDGETLLRDCGALGEGCEEGEEGCGGEQVHVEEFGVSWNTEWLVIC